MGPKTGVHSGSLIEYKYSLDKSSRKFRCPGCGQKRLVAYRDNATGNYLDEKFGRCDRENNCGYHVWPTGNKTLPIVETTPIIKEVDFIPLEYVEKTINPAHHSRNTLIAWLSRTFGGPIARHAALEYYLGTSLDGSAVYWYIDVSERVRQGKVIQYTDKGKRNKEIQVYAIGKRILGKDKNFQFCFFGEHLLTEYPNRLVGIVEAEKTALIASIFYPDINWLAAGGALGGCKWREYEVYKVLKDKKVTFFPDYGYANKKTGKTCFDEWTERVAKISEVLPGSFSVSDLLEVKLKDKERNDEDLADLLLLDRDNDLAMINEDGGIRYPLIFDTNRIIESK